VAKPSTARNLATWGSSSDPEPVLNQLEWLESCARMSGYSTWEGEQRDETLNPYGSAFPEKNFLS
jgi:hypothetical protein